MRYGFARPTSPRTGAGQDPACDPAGSGQGSGDTGQSPSSSGGSGDTGQSPASSGEYGVIWEGTTPTDDPVAAADTVAPWADAGATWWLESDWAAGQGAAALDSFRRRLRAGPPRPA